MLVFDTIQEFRHWRSSLAPTTTIGLVPTMGALHEGHAALISDAVRSCDVTVVTIFVNKIQFNDPKDFERYPRTLEADLDIARRSGAAAVFVPQDEELASLLAGHRLHSGPIGDLWEGTDRPGHFDGVLTVVNQLFSIVEPTRARFGEKDRQQLVIITRWAKSAWPKVIIDRGRTVRAADGLALSSRNARLSETGRMHALTICAALEAIMSSYSSGTRSVDVLVSIGKSCLANDITLHYLALVDGQTLEPQESARPGCVVLIAATVDGVRLIDNCELT